MSYHDLKRQAVLLLFYYYHCDFQGLLFFIYTIGASISSHICTSSLILIFRYKFLFLDLKTCICILSPNLITLSRGIFGHYRRAKAQRDIHLGLRVFQKCFMRYLHTCNTNTVCVFTE